MPRSDADACTQVSSPRRRAFPSDRIARGWYQIGWSTEFTRDTAVPLYYFDRALVAYRGADGELIVLDGHCPHLGAHLGHGGQIEGDAIRCPFHGWLWAADGRNIEIPYGNRNPMPNLTLRRWTTREIDGLALVFYCEDPTREPDPLPDAFNRYEQPVWPVSDLTTHIWRGMSMAPHVIAENSADAAHFKYVHRSHEVATVSSFEVGDGCFSAQLRLPFGGHTQSTWATPEGPVEGFITTEQWGFGMGRAQLVGFDNITYVMGATPVTPYETDLRSTTFVPTRRSNGEEVGEDLLRRWVDQQNAQVDSDLVIWTNQSYVDRPPYERSEVKPMRAFRQWAASLYEHAPAERVGANEGGGR